MTTIEYTQTALEEFKALIDHIYQDSPQSAKSYFYRLEKAIGNLSHTPLMGIACPKKKIISDCRILIVDNYLIFYHYNPSINLIKILHLTYGNVNYKKLFM